MTRLKENNPPTSHPPRCADWHSIVQNIKKAVYKRGFSFSTNTNLKFVFTLYNHFVRVIVDKGSSSSEVVVKHLTIPVGDLNKITK